MNNLQLRSNNFIQEIKYYFFGLLFSIVLTIIPFFVVFEHILKLYLTCFVITICAFIQFFCHLKYFLHLNYTTEHYWHFIFLIFTVLIVFIIVSGSLWIMYNLNHHAHYIYHGK